ncbi:MAG: ImmA/IrrE family metallo-endopeptidase [Ruminococcus sp.]|nr:ImmA/IrrE family metallo-endopeptidase [Ruminococcus sp.]
MLLNGDRYNEIQKAVLALYKQINVNKFPIDCFEICKQLEILFLPYSSLTEKKQKAALEISKDGFNILLEKSKGSFYHIIFYNDKMPPHRIRFTILHELAHIILDHSEHSEVAESEANYFAKYALAPPPLVHMLEIEDYLELSDRFDLSSQCAYYAMQSYWNWLRFGSSQYLEHETKIISLFTPIIHSVSENRKLSKF